MITMNSLRQYSMSILMSIGNSVRNSTLNRLDPITWKKINKFGICSSIQRGCRGGKNKQRMIKPVNNIFDRFSTKSDRGVNFANLSSIPINHNQQENLIRVQCKSSTSEDVFQTRFASWNAWSIKEKTTSLVDFVIDNDLDVVAHWNSARRLYPCRH